MLTAITTITILAMLFGLLLGYSAIRFHVEGDPIADQVDALLPQTQCGQCGFPGCRPYAEAIAAGETEINHCAPGGEATMLALSELLGRDPLPMADQAAAEKPKAIAYIVEEECIGCTLCLQACPVDAILGSAKSMHTVIASECTGCELCIPPCPVECIHMHPIEENLGNWKWPFPNSLGETRSEAST
ncbi:MAG: electron transport complex subunit RsxB [Chromatiales bacterium]|jgi:electron transport complex protein RnfB